MAEPLRYRHGVTEYYISLLQVYRHGVIEYWIDGYNEMTSTWLRWVNCARHIKEQNLGNFQCHGRLFYMTIKDVLPGQELLIYYGHEYAEEGLGINIDRYEDETIEIDLYKPYPCWRI